MIQSWENIILENDDNLIVPEQLSLYVKISREVLKSLR
jgi:hypothetical protein